MENPRNERMKLFNFDYMLDMDEYFGCKINGYDGFTFTQKVMFQIFSNGIALTKGVPTTPTMTGNILTKSTG